MLHYGARSPKRSVAISNSSAIGGLDRGPLRNWKKIKAWLGKRAVQTCKRYKDAKGKRRWVGTKELRSTEKLCSTFILTSSARL